MHNNLMKLKSTDLTCDIRVIRVIRDSDKKVLEL